MNWNLLLIGFQVWESHFGCYFYVKDQAEMSNDRAETLEIALVIERYFKGFLTQISLYMHGWTNWEKSCITWKLDRKLFLMAWITRKWMNFVKWKMCASFFVDFELKKFHKNIWSEKISYLKHNSSKLYKFFFKINLISSSLNLRKKFCTRSKPEVF